MTPLILLVVLIVCANAVPIKIQSGGRIVGGFDVEIEDFPYQVSLQSLGEHWCGGSIISKNYILTAGHCIGRKPNDFFTVRSGSAYHAKNGHVHNVLESRIHEEFDVAILKVQPSFVFDETQQPIRLAVEKPNADSLAFVTGWGHLDENKNQFSDKLQAVEMPVVSNKDCSEAYSKEILEHEICAGLLGVGGKDSCQGDSGGPLVVDHHLAGVVSWGAGCARPESPGVYVNVAHFKNWITDHSDI